MERLSSADSSEQAAAYAAALLEYQKLNTAFWDLIEPTIDLSGAYEQIDRLQTRRFKVNDLRDGVEYYRYALKRAATDPIATQIEAVNKLSSYSPLSGGDNVTQVQLDVHMNGLLNVWLGVSGNDPTTKFEEFRHGC